MALLSGWVSRWLQGEVWRERSMSADVQDSRGVRGPPKPSSQEETSAGSTWQRGPILGSRPQPTLLCGGGRPRPTHQRLQVHQVCHRSLLLHGRCKIRQGCRLQSTSKGTVYYYIRPHEIFWRKISNFFEIFFWFFPFEISFFEIFFVRNFFEQITKIQKISRNLLLHY